MIKSKLLSLVLLCGLLAAPQTTKPSVRSATAFFLKDISSTVLHTAIACLTTIGIYKAISAYSDRSGNEKNLPSGKVFFTPYGVSPLIVDIKKVDLQQLKSNAVTLSKEVLESLTETVEWFQNKIVMNAQLYAFPTFFPAFFSLTSSTLIGFGQAEYLLLTHEDFSEHVLGAQKNVTQYSATVSIAKNNKRRIISKIIQEKTFTCQTAHKTSSLAAEWLQKMLPKDYIGIIQPSITLRDNNTCYLYAIRIKQENSASSQDILFETFAAAEQLYKAAPKPVFFWAKPFAVMRAGLWLTIELLFPSQEKRTIN